MPAISYCQADPAYRAEPAYAQSHVKHILKSPAHFLAAKKQRFTPTLTMQIGSALHCLVLEGKEEFDRNYILKPDGISLTTKEGKEWKAAAGKKTVLSTSDQYSSWNAVHGMAESLQRLEWFNPNQVDYRKFNELSIYWEADGIDCKCRLDRLVFTPESGQILDLKTTDSVNSNDFLRKVIGSMNYLFQSAWYSEAVEAAFEVPATFIFIGIERTAPYATKIFEISKDMLDEGKRQTRAARRILRSCLQDKQWPSPSVEHELLELPTWFSSPLEYATMNDDSSLLDQVFGTISK